MMDNVEFPLGEINEEELTVEEMDARKQLTIFDRLENQNHKTVSLNPEQEDVPAYIRRGIKLVDINHSSETEISRTSLFEESPSKPELRTNNSFLHDNVD